MDVRTTMRVWIFLLYKIKKIIDILQIVCYNKSIL